MSIQIVQAVSLSTNYLWINAVYCFVGYREKIFKEVMNNLKTTLTDQ